MLRNRFNNLDFNKKLNWHFNSEDDDSTGGSNGGTSNNSSTDDSNRASDKGDVGDNGSKLTNEERKLLHEVMDKKKTIKDQNEKIDELAKKLSAFEGVDIEKWKGMVEKEKADADAKKEAERKRLEEKGEFEKILADVNKSRDEKERQFSDQLLAKDNEIIELKSQIDKLNLKTAFGLTDVRSEITLSNEKLMRLYGSHFEIKDGNIVGYDKPSGESNRGVLVDDRGNPLPFDGALRHLIDIDPDRDHIRVSDLSAGANSKGAKGKTPDQKLNIRKADPRDLIAEGFKERGK